MSPLGKNIAASFSNNFDDFSSKTKIIIIKQYSLKVM